MATSEMSVNGPSGHGPSGHGPLNKRPPGSRPFGDPWRRWLICTTLFAATVLNYLDRQTMAVCARMIKDEFGLSNSEFGELLAAFRGTYAVTHVIAGAIADRFPVRILFPLAVALWSAAGAAAALVRSPRELAFTRQALGVGEAFNWPCALRVTANIMPREDRALANGFFASGAAIGAMISPLLIMPMALRWGWRTAFVVVGALGLLWIPFWVWSTRGWSRLTTSEASDLETTRRPSLASELVVLMRHPGFWLLMLFAGTINPCSYVIAEWIPLYMHEKRDLGLFAAAFVATLLFIGSDVGSVAGGVMAKLLARQGWSVRQARGAAVALGALLIVPAAAAAYVDDAAACIALLAMASMGIAWTSANYLAALQDLSFGNVALVGGLLGGFGNLVAWKINPLIGAYVDRTGNYQLVFVALGVMPLVGLAALLGFDAVTRPTADPGNAEPADEGDDDQGDGDEDDGERPA